jgi:acyl carrier protein
VASEGGPDAAARGVEERILAFMRSELLGPDTTVNVDDELLSGGILDSMAVLRLAAFVEEEFRFKMQPADFVIENFQTVAVLAEYVRRATDHAGRPSSNPEDDGR